MEMYVTTETALGTEPLASFLQGNSKKERILYVYHKPDASLSFDKIKELIDASHKINLEFIPVNNPVEWALSIGYLMAKNNIRTPVYTILPPGHEFTNYAKEITALQEYKSVPPTGKRTRKATAQKQESTLEHTPASDKTEEPRLSDELVREDKVEPSSSQETTPGATLAADTGEPLFMSDDSEAFFCKQISSTPEIGRRVAECMKHACGDMDFLDELVKLELSDTDVEPAALLDAVHHNYDLLYGSLFIKRR